ncbi:MULTISPECIES: SMC-Scp complex subunit ScpB [Ensifer]|uniref:SMC-Scp complex subunit ScpB n=1 Tax=Ensifer canadensis TaxID=555315 RepID=A0AAW4FBN4_9HYPH|nr:MULTISPECIES: SMC-Scp complex subunit ScpB [Ensifer]AHK44267.1 segregation and condensation protein B [Ensifer adhaerens OV14]MDP9629981.1 segregation and condensation protein B [Ensifer adhaerens]KQU96869.1 segregation and condensation protein B [Ensifer sp. Root31]KQW60856.1 segregation and condensation protein B [Ensifer sp. Root1252]KQW75398.1 segregation and condensation protein B [Ensifer sp. Root127]
MAEPQKYLPDVTDEDGENDGLVFDPRMEQETERIAEALVFASAQPISEAYIATRLPRGADVPRIMARLKALYAGRGVNLVQVADHWAFRTAADLSFVVQTDEKEVRKLSRAALEVLAIIAYHQPVTRAEIEDIRGVQTSKGTLDVLMEAGWVRFRGRRRTPGRPVTFGTTRDFLDHFGLEELRDLPGIEELKGAGLLSGRVPSNLHIPVPVGEDDLAENEDPITQLDLEELGLLTPKGEEAD